MANRQLQPQDLRCRELGHAAMEIVRRTEFASFSTISIRSWASHAIKGARADFATRVTPSNLEPRLAGHDLFGEKVVTARGLGRGPSAPNGRGIRGDVWPATASNIAKGAKGVTLFEDKQSIARGQGVASGSPLRLTEPAPFVEQCCAEDVTRGTRACNQMLKPLRAVRTGMTTIGTTRAARATKTKGEDEEAVPHEAEEVALRPRELPTRPRAADLPVHQGDVPVQQRCLPARRIWTLLTRWSEIWSPLERLLTEQRRLLSN